MWYTRSDVIRKVTPHLAHVLDGTKLPLLGAPAPGPLLLTELAAATTAAGGGGSKGEPMREAKPIWGGTLL